MVTRHPLQVVDVLGALEMCSKGRSTLKGGGGAGWGWMSGTGISMQLQIRGPRRPRTPNPGHRSPPPPQGQTQTGGPPVAILLEPVSDEDDKLSFLNRALALNYNLPFGREKLQMADRSIMHMRTHDRLDVWIASSTRDSRSMSPPPTYKLLRFMTLGGEVDKVVFYEPDVRDNQYTIQVHRDLMNCVLGAIGLNCDDVHLLPGKDRRNWKLFFTDLNEEQVNAVVSQFWFQAKVSDPACGMVSRGRPDEHVCRL